MSTISICIATYNGEKYIFQQLNSILKQINDNDEVIISDDSSTDRTLQIIRHFNDVRIKIYPNNTFYSPILNFENALNKASGDLIFISDQDDIWEDNKIAVISQLLQQYDLVVSDCSIIDSEGRLTNDSFFKIRKSGKGLLKNLYKNSYLGCCMAFNKRILRKAMPFPKSLPMHDMWIGLISELYGKSFFCDATLIKYRRHSDSVTGSSILTGSGFRSTFSKISMIKFRVYLIFYLVVNWLKNRKEIV